MKLLVIDNYDSFTYNLVFMIRDMGYSDVDVYRNDKIGLEEVKQYDKILLSPGPGLPTSAGVMMDVLKAYADTKSVLGVCLGHQGIGEAFGAKLFNLPTVLHGVAGNMQVLTPDQIFDNVPDTFKATHYHSWAIEESSLPQSLEVTARDETGMIMAIRHTKYDVRGVQFHPESVLTEHGETMLKNWIEN